jgi:hypothetical protein
MGYRVQAMQWGHETSRDVVSRSPWQVCASGPQPPRCWASYGLLPHSHTRTYLCLVVAVQHTYLKILILCRSTTWELTLTTRLSPDTWRCACCGCLGTLCSTDPREIKCRGSWSPILGRSPTPLWMQSQSPRSVGVALFWLRPTGVCSLACSRHVQQGDFPRLSPATSPLVVREHSRGRPLVDRHEQLPGHDPADRPTMGSLWCHRRVCTLNFVH